MSPQASMPTQDLLKQLSRRGWFTRSATGFAGLALGALLAEDQARGASAPGLDRPAPLRARFRVRGAAALRRPPERFRAPRRRCAELVGRILAAQIPGRPLPAQGHPRALSRAAGDRAREDATAAPGPAGRAQHRPT